MVSPQKFSSYLRKPYELDAEAETQLREIIKEHPYFNNAWLLLARSQHNQSSEGFDTTLKQASMYAGDRALLYKLVNVDESEVDEKLKVQVADAAAEASTPIATPSVEETPEVNVGSEVIEEPTEAKEEIIAQPEETEEPVAEEEIAAIVEEAEQPIIETQEEEIEAVTTPPQEEEIEKTEAITKDEPVAEEDKVKSAYEEIFGAGENSEEDNTETNDNFGEEVATEEEQPEFALFDDEDDFVLQVDDNGNADLMADETVGVEKEEAGEVTEQKEVDAVVEEHISEEDFELNIGEHLDKDEDGIIEEPPVEDNTEETFELNTADAIAENKQEETDNIEGEQEAEIEEAQPIAFKLSVEEKIEERKIAASEEKDIVSEGVDTAPSAEEEKSALVSEGTFFEWLSHLKKLQPEEGDSEKKNEVTKAAENTQGEASIEIKGQQPVSVEKKSEPKKSSVDDIISRFININPSISRPKAEFYNPSAKSRESDTENDDLATETLAKIYSEQHLYDKAVEVYQRLIKLYPEKEEEYKKQIAEIENQ